MRASNWASGLGSSSSAAATVAAFASRPSASAGAVFAPTDGGHLQVSDGSSWYNVVGGLVLKEPPAVATLATQTNFGTSTLVKTNGSLVFTPQKGTGLLRTAGKAIATWSGSSVTCVSNTLTPAGAVAGAGVYMRESSTGKIYSAAWAITATGFMIHVGRWTNATTNAALVEYYGFEKGFATGPRFIRLTPVSTNISVQISFDGVNFQQVHSTALSTAFTGSTANEFGLCAYVSNSTTDAIHVIPHLSFVGD
jgi:hypothetical protein